ncbi:ParB-like nuclease family protein [Nocardia tenerifensis]|uniref:ParB-like nuclease family protein n=1 Tax=Nocardia tenerifensis TaxID=228006 RepID=A0A318JUK5_9NOCA|nr:ParB N-terminal domain-containing protein [Nocardia tenerifensis]PXX60351.1 ParB-like nuclease family protein [Nocardia tenerifensis]
MLHNLDPARKAFLEARTKSNTVPVPAWPRSEKNLPQAELETTWVRFSVTNHRTRAEQERERRLAGREDLFTADPLGPVAQDAQYRILCAQPSFDELKRDLQSRGQQEPAIVTADGILINGNRRTAGLRALWEAGELSARYVSCLVLPADATTYELVDLEAELQVANSLKQDYSWVNEAMLIEELYDRAQKNWEHVANRMHRTVADVRGMYDKLQQLHQLVELSGGTRLHLDFVENESVFDELSKYIKNKPQQEADSVRAVYFLGALTGTPYRQLRHLRRADSAQLVLNEMAEDVTMRPILEAADAATPMASDDLLDDLVGSSEPFSPLHGLLAFVAQKRPEANIVLDDGDRVQVRDVLTSIGSSIMTAADEAKEEDRDQSALQAPLVRAGKAIDELKRVVAALPRARRYPEWDEAEFAKRVAELNELLDKIR